ASARRLAVAAVVPPPGPLFGLTTDHFIRVARPLLQWTASRGAFSPIAYTVVLDGKPIATTAATSLELPAALTDGVHQWQVIARDSLGQQTPGPVRALRIAARPPAVAIAVSGSRRAGAALGFAVAVKAPAGLAALTIDFGDGTARARGVRASHRYARAGRFTVRVSAVDRLGNRAVVARPIAIV
ncbi:MAG TPA: PKD domain-containing protein, partial [Solirubrobacteraceae bacterium]|nr:PKD domain-containing protein [Solirubrobacteraceae bacterium]